MIGALLKLELSTWEETLIALQVLDLTHTKRRAGLSEELCGKLRFCERLLRRLPEEVMKELCWATLLKEAL